MRPLDTLVMNVHLLPPIPTHPVHPALPEVGAVVEPAVLGEPSVVLVAVMDMSA
ncbi:MAG: hypothetical protein Q7J73_08565 [Dehalococcoidales bacterium]|nr:hypothetical protein [Dehalococcoidales bacterium]